MDDSIRYGVLMLAASAAGLVAVHSHRVAARVRIPTPAFFLLAAIAAAHLAPDLLDPQHRTVERVVTAALVLILFDGGLHIGARRFRSSASGILTLGLAGTFLTLAGASVLVHVLLGVSWYLSVLVATAIAPTDPAVVFSVLGQREIEGPSGTLLEGESGANDPVGIALMAGLLGAGGLSGTALVHAAGTFTLQMLVGVAVGLLGGHVLLRVMRRVTLPAEGLYLVRTLLGAGLLFGLATVAHGSGFLAVFVAGIVLGDEAAPYKREIAGFHGALASLGEIVAFAMLGFTVDLDTVTRTDVWLPAVGLGLLLALVVRPLLAAPLLLRSPLDRGERVFVLLSGLKGAVPLLLGSLLLEQQGGQRLYAVVVIVVMVSVVLQGGAVPTLARRLGVRMRSVEPEPFSLGVRLRDAPRNAHHVTVRTGTPADGAVIAVLADLSRGVWVSLVVRDGAVIVPRGDERLRADDDVLLLIHEDASADDLLALF